MFYNNLILNIYFCMYAYYFLHICILFLFIIICEILIKFIIVSMLCEYFIIEFKRDSGGGGSYDGGSKKHHPASEALPALDPGPGAGLTMALLVNIPIYQLIYPHLYE